MRFRLGSKQTTKLIGILILFLFSKSKYLGVFKKLSQTTQSCSKIFNMIFLKDLISWTRNISMSRFFSKRTIAVGLGWPLLYAGYLVIAKRYQPVIYSCLSNIAQGHLLWCTDLCLGCNWQTMATRIPAPTAGLKLCVIYVIVCRVRSA